MRHAERGNRLTERASFSAGAGGFPAPRELRFGKEFEQIALRSTEDALDVVDEEDALHSSSPGSKFKVPVSTCATWNLNPGAD